MTNVTKIAFIGTGSMGRPIIFKLLDKGYSVKVYDKYKQTAATVVAAGAIWADTPKEAARDCQVIITCLPLPHHVLENMLGENGAVEGMESGHIWIDTSTTDYHNTKYIASVAAGKGIFSLEAPVSNLSHMGVDFANVSFYVGGDQAGYDIVEEIFNTMGKISFYVGDIGVAQTVKLLTNLLFYTAMVVLGEVLIIAKTTGIPLAWMWDFIKASKGNSFVTEQVAPFIFDGSYDSSCTLEITVKDTDLTVKLADELNVPLPLGRIIEERYRQAGVKYKAHDNHVIVTQLIEEENNLDLRLPGFVAPSKYGANPNYIRPEEYVEDKYGRIKPWPYQQNYQPPTAKLKESLTEIAQSLTDFMAYVNYVSLQEAYMLGEKMGLQKKLLKEVVKWSCGTSWVFDNEDSFSPDRSILKKIKAYHFSEKARIATVEKILSVL